MKSIRKIISLLDRRQKLKLIPLSLAVVVMSLLEVAGIGSLGPFVAVLARPELIQTEPILKTLYDSGGFTSDFAFFVFLGVAVFVLVLFASAFKMVTQYIIFRFVADGRYTLGMKLFGRYIDQPYSYFLDHNTSELSKNLLAEVDQVISGVLLPAMDTFARSVLAIAILVFLFVTDPLVAGSSAVVLGGLYAFLYLVIRRKLLKKGEEVRDSNALRFRAAGEAFQGIKDVKILGVERTFLRKYGSGARWFSNTQATKRILSVLPGLAMQAVSMGLAVGIALLLIVTQGSVVTVLPLLAVYALAAQRLVPNLQVIFQGIAQFRYYTHTADALHKDMTSLNVPVHARLDGEDPREEPVRFNRDIRVVNLEFRYPTSKQPVLSIDDMTIGKDTSVGFVGTTGCGKTTLVDIVMALLQPTSGGIMVDDTMVNPADTPRLRGWQRSFGYVPQQISLLDDTVAANIAFGEEPGKLNMDAVEKSARIANLHDFVVAELPKGYGTTIGERGIRLSGGQRQRIGIARALYRDPSILVLDEATSALDSVTEDAVMEAINTLMHKKTIIMIAHRISTVRNCDRIYLLESGRVAASGTYDELVSGHEQFRAMAGQTGDQA